MSGHSKWSTIKHKKAAIDAKRGKAFSVVLRHIRVAAKEGKSGDPAMNATLRTVLEKAREVNMPHELIQRAIDKGLGKTKSGNSIDEVVYEGYGSGGVGLMVFAVTDNRNRTAAEVRNAFEKFGGSLGGPGSTAYLFEIAGNNEPVVKIPITIDDENTKKKVADLIEYLEDNEDVEMVVSNLQ